MAMIMGSRGKAIFSTRGTMTYQITLEEKAAPEDRRILGLGISQHVEELFPGKWIKDITFFLRDESGTIVGGVLLERAETIARSSGVDELRLYTNAEFSTNLSFYARRGFVEFLREPHAAGGEIVYMKKSIER